MLKNSINNDSVNNSNLHFPSEKNYCDFLTDLNLTRRIILSVGHTVYIQFLTFNDFDISNCQFVIYVKS